MAKLGFLLTVVLPFGFFRIKQENPDMKTKKMNVKGSEIAITDHNGSSYISLTDILRPFGNEVIIYNWLRNKNTIEFLVFWEQLTNPEFKLYLIKEFQRLKEEENRQKSPDWSLQRTLAKINYRIHNDAIKENLIPSLVGLAGQIAHPSPF